MYIDDEGIFNVKPSELRLRRNQSALFELSFHPNVRNNLFGREIVASVFTSHPRDIVFPFVATIKAIGLISVWIMKEIEHSNAIHLLDIGVSVNFIESALITTICRSFVSDYVEWMDSAIWNTSNCNNATVRATVSGLCDVRDQEVRSFTHDVPIRSTTGVSFLFETNAWGDSSV